jgi:hypothetical protein
MPSRVGRVRWAAGSACHQLLRADVDHPPRPGSACPNPARHRRHSPRGPHISVRRGAGPRAARSCHTVCRSAPRRSCRLTGAAAGSTTSSPTRPVTTTATAHLNPVVGDPGLLRCSLTATTWLRVACVRRAPSGLSPPPRADDAESTRPVCASCESITARGRIRRRPMLGRGAGWSRRDARAASRAAGCGGRAGGPRAVRRSSRVPGPGRRGTGAKGRRSQ